MPLKKYLDYDGLAYLLQRFPKTTVHCTFDDEFAGETATLTHGTTTYTKTVPATSPYELTFAINELGTWTLQSSYLGTQYSDTVDITYLGQKGEVGLTIVPDGSTAEPVNSIPIWLKCANLNKSYTTLAEVLADTETYETLLADSNACQYMKRSTGWINAGLVPKMTSNTTPSGTASASSVYNNMADYQPWKAFNGDYNTFWAGNTVGTTGSGTITYMFPNAVVVKRARIVTRERGTLTIDTASIQGSNDGSTWSNDLWSFTNEDNIDCTAILNNNTAYSYYRLTIKTNSTSSNVAHPGIGLIQYYASSDASIVDDQDAMARLGKFDYAANLLSNDPTWAAAIGNSDYMSSVWDTSVPNMTGYTAPSGRVYASSENNNVASYAWNAFSTSNNYNWDAIQNSSLPQWLAYEFPYPVIVKKARVCSYGNRLTKVKIQGSNDGFTNDVHDLTEEVSVSQDYNNPTVLLIPTNTSSYTSYRFLGTESGQDSGGWRSLTGAGGGCNFYGRASEEVLVPLVPTMTSNTTPSGRVIYDSQYNSTTYAAWKAFDKNTSSEWSSTDTSMPHWCGYDFEKPVIVNMISLWPGNDNISTRIKDFKIQGSNTGNENDWNDIYTGVAENINNYQYINFNNNSSYRYYRIYIMSRHGSTTEQITGITELQFYQRTVQTNIIHSTPNDTIYMLEDGDPLVLATTNSDGDGILDFSQLPAGPVTLYSSVAKNPDDLTADYSKTITITKTQYGGTTEAYLMPDTVKTLYWWGYENNFTICNSSDGWSNWGSSSSSWGTVTRNTNSININAAANIVTAVGNKNPISGSKAHAIGYANNATYAYFTIQQTKAVKASYQASAATSFTTYNSHIDITYDFTDAYITPQNAANSGYITYLYAFWYE